MRINDIARIAGVTTRTIRYYHRIGLVEEPDRDTNNYRRYETHHLIRLLRVRRLTTLGFSLENAGSLLDGDEGDSKSALEALDRELETQIKNLRHQRMLIARLAESPGSPDIPVEFASFHAAFSASLPAGKRQAASDTSVLLGHLADREEREQLKAMLGRMTQPDRIEQMTDLEARYQRLTTDSPDTEITDLIEGYIAAVNAIRTEAPKGMVRRADLVKLLVGHVVSQSNSKQREVLEAVVKRLRSSPAAHDNQVSKDANLGDRDHSH